MADLTITRREDCGFVTIMARKGIGADRIGAALGVDAPLLPARRQGDEGLSLIGTGPGTWLATREAADPFWSDTLRDRLEGLASVSDQSGAYLVYRIAGADARTLLQRGVSLDLHPAVFGPGAAAASVIAHISLILWAIDDRPSYDVAVYRSYAESFQHWLDEGVAAL